MTDEPRSVETVAAILLQQGDEGPAYARRSSA